MLVIGAETASKAFAEACYGQRLDFVGITDHNFQSKGFIPHLQTAFDEIEREFSHKITLFPGFEFEAAGVGKGVHVLCFFEPGTDLAKLDSILTECGVGYPRVNAAKQLEKSDKNLKDILRIAQEKHGGIVIMPHAMTAFSTTIRYRNGCNFSRRVKVFVGLARYFEVAAGRG